MREEFGEAGAEKENEEAPGWDAITACFEGIYPGQTNPIHYAPIIKWMLGGNDPLDGISVYDGGKYWHFVTYGLSELYEKESEEEEYSGYGMEFTFKLEKAGSEEENTDNIRGICGILQAIARITFESGEIFGVNEYLYTGQTQGIDPKGASGIVGFITKADADAKSMVTPFGKVEFVEFIGVTDAELNAVRDKKLTVEELFEKLGTDVTSYQRKSMV